MRRTSLIRFAVFAAAVVTVSPAPLHVSLGNYVFDPESIPQNEKILKLFIRLAAQTANRLINLKIKSHLNANEVDEMLEYFKDPSTTPSGRKMIGAFVEDVMEETMRLDEKLGKPEGLRNSTDGVTQGETDPANIPIDSNTAKYDVSETPVPGEEAQVEVENRGLFNTDQLTNPKKASAQMIENELGNQRSVTKREAIDELLSSLDESKKKFIDNFGQDAWDETQKELCADHPGHADARNTSTPAPPSGSEATRGVERVPKSHGSQASDIGPKQYQGALDHLGRTMSNTAGKIGQLGSEAISTGFGFF